MTRTRTVPLALLALLGSCLSAWAPGPAPEFDLSWSTIDGGGGTSSESTSGFDLSGTIGQHDAGPAPGGMTGGALAGGGFELIGGFWPGASAAPGRPPCLADCAGSGGGDDLVNVTDLLALLAQWGVPGGGSCDINDDGVVNVTDLLALLATWGGCA
jgi:hypothetical protein